MNEFEALLGLILAAVILAAIARKVGVPYPAFLALGGAALAFLPGVPVLTIEPQLVLALFVAPVLLDSAYDASPRDLRDNWVPQTESEEAAPIGLGHDELLRRALAAARTVVFEMRATNAIGDDAFHQLEEEFDWMEMGAADRNER